MFSHLRFTKLNSSTRVTAVPDSGKWRAIVSRPMAPLHLNSVSVGTFRDLTTFATDLPSLAGMRGSECLQPYRTASLIGRGLRRERRFAD